MIRLFFFSAGAHPEFEAECSIKLLISLKMCVRERGEGEGLGAALRIRSSFGWLMSIHLCRSDITNAGAKCT